MKPCRTYEKLIALHAAGSLTHDETGRILAHVRECSPCAGFLAQMRSICNASRNEAHALPSVEVNESFYDHIRAGVESAASVQIRTAKIPLRLAWACVIVAVGALSWMLPSWLSRTRPAPAPQGLIKLESRNGSESSKQIRYRLAINRSFEELDQMLAPTASSGDASVSKSLQLRNVLEF